MVSLKKILFKKELSIEDLAYISKLLDTNLSLNHCFDLLINKRNKEIFDEIKKQLNSGALIENIIVAYLPKEIKAYMLPLLKTQSFSRALTLALDFNDKHKDNETSLLSSIAYPCILLFVTITALYLFDLYGMDAIFDLIGNFDSDINIYSDIRFIFRIFINIFYYGLLIGVLLIIFFSRPSRITLLYIFFSKYFPNSLINTYYSEEFVSLLLICVKRGYKTKEALHVLMEMKTKPIVAFLAFHLDEGLMQGESMKEAIKQKYYDLSLSRFIKIANYTNDFENIINSYTILAKEKVKRKMKQYASTIQVTTYALIGMIIIFVYQILFMPMQAISAY